MYSMMALVNNSACFRVAKRAYPKNSHDKNFFVTA